MAEKLPDLYPLSPVQIQPLIDDLRLVVEDNAKIFFAVDPFELTSFCFPIDLSDQHTDVDIKSLADDQAALFEVFYRQNAVLLSEYSTEMERSLNYFEHTTDRIRDKSDMVDRLIKEGEHVWGEFPEGNVDAHAEFLKKNFNVILAIAMGTFSVGISRLQDIYHTRLIKANFTTKVLLADVPTVRRILNGYQRTAKWAPIKKLLSQPFWDEDDNSKQVRSAEVDASAIDRIIYLNSAFEEARLAGELSSRYLFVYLSSARRTARVFLGEATNRFLPIVNGAPYNFWRTRQQIFAYVVHKSREGNHAESMANLERVREVLDEVNKFDGLFSSEDCSDCVLKVSSVPSSGLEPSTCRWRDFCRKVKALDDEIQKARNEVQNLGLINTLNDYEKLRSAKPAGASQKQYLNFFRETFNSVLMRDARPKMERLQRWILVKSEFTNSFTEAMDFGKPGFDQSSLRSPEDFITGSGQYLPTKPNLSGGAYKDILQSILGFYRNPAEFAQIEHAYKRYVELDTETKETNLEHELIRCFLYLALPRNMKKSAAPDTAPDSGDEKAYHHAQAIMEEDQLLDRKQWDQASAAIKQEFRYVQCWAARRTGHFEKAIELADQGISHQPDDPRFLHGRCLAIYSWLTKKPDNAVLPISEAIEGTKKAISLYESQARNIDNQDVIAANYNNLAYFLAWSIELDQAKGFDERVAAGGGKVINEARTALDCLKSVVNKSDWEATKHPEFFHTEAYLEYQEFTIYSAEGKLEAACAKLNNAKREIDIAIRLLAEGPKKNDYRDLRTRIERGLQVYGSYHNVT